VQLLCTTAPGACSRNQFHRLPQRCGGLIRSAALSRQCTLLHNGDVKEKTHRTPNRQAAVVVVVVVVVDVVVAAVIRRFRSSCSVLCVQWFHVFSGNSNSNSNSSILYRRSNDSIHRRTKDDDQRVGCYLLLLTTSFLRFSAVSFPFQAKTRQDKNRFAKRSDSNRTRRLHHES
jgi:hypothetical protein